MAEESKPAVKVDFIACEEGIAFAHVLRPGSSRNHVSARLSPDLKPRTEILSFMGGMKMV